jgi:hypothetical protein
VGAMTMALFSQIALHEGYLCRVSLSTIPLIIDFNQSNNIEESETIKKTIKLKLPGALLTSMACQGYGQQKVPRKQE